MSKKQFIPGGTAIVTAPNAFRVLGLKLYEQLNEYKIAAAISRESIGTLREIGSKEFMVDALLDLANIYYKSQEYKKAIDVHREYISEKDLLLNAESAHKLKLMRIKFETSKKDSEIELLTRKMELQSNRNIYLVTICVAIFILLAFMFFYYKLKLKFYRQRQELLQYKDTMREKQMEKKEREIASAALLIEHKNRALNDINQQLSDVSPEEAYISKVQEVKKTINNSINTDAGWVKWKIHFEKVHPDFFSELERTYPQLSQNEIRFCAYVKLKLSTKEIAQISGIGVKAVQMYKYRLKKKFNLDKGTNFDKFLYAIGDSVNSTEVLPITK